MSSERFSIPPSHVNVPPDPVYDADLPDPLFRTYVRLRGLAWQSSYRHTPPLTIEELAQICHRSVRSAWGHLSELRRQGLISWECLGQGRMVFDLQTDEEHAGDPLEDLAVGRVDDTGSGTADVGTADEDAGQRQGAEDPLQDCAVADRGDVVYAPGGAPGQQQRPEDPLQKSSVDDGSLQDPSVDSLQDFSVDGEPLQNFAVEPLQNLAVNDHSVQNFAVDSLQNLAVNGDSVQNFAVDSLQNLAVDGDSVQNFAVKPLQNLAVEGDSLQNLAVDPLQSFAVHDGVVVDESLREDLEQQQPPPPPPPPPPSPPQPPARLQNASADGRERAALEALAAYGVDVGVPAARKAARLPHVTPQLVRAWGDDLRQRPCRNLPGLLLYKLHTNRTPPRTDERRGGRRRASTGGAVQAAILPETLRQQLDQVGLVGPGPRREVADAWTADHERVEAWTDYVASRPDLGAGFLLVAVRSDEPAPALPAQNDRARRYVSGEYAEYIQH